MGDKVDIVNAIKRFSDKGWMPGLCGAIAMIQNISDDNHKIYITCNQPKKGFITNNDIFLLRKIYEAYDIVTPLNQKDEKLEISKWSNVFLEILSKHTDARCIVQLCPKWPVLAARMSLIAWQKNSESQPNILRLSHWKLLENFDTDSDLSIPIINYGSIDSMGSSINNALSFNPKTPAIIIRDYGILIWGSSMKDTENRIELLDYLCELQILDFKLRAN